MWLALHTDMLEAFLLPKVFSDLVRRVGDSIKTKLLIPSQRSRRDKLVCEPKKVSGLQEPELLKQKCLNNDLENGAGNFPSIKYLSIV